MKIYPQQILGFISSIFTFSVSYEQQSSRKHGNKAEAHKNPSIKTNSKDTNEAENEDRHVKEKRGTASSGQEGPFALHCEPSVV